MKSSQQKILDYCLKNAVFDGWTTKMLENASISAGLDKEYHQILFPNGAADVFAFFVEETNRLMAETAIIEGLRTHEKIRALIVWRLEHIRPYKLAVKSLLKLLVTSPFVTLKASYSAIDAMWRLAGDTSTDFNFYTKRTLLAGVYSSTLLYYLEDKSEGHEKTIQFLDNRLSEVGKFNKFMANIKEKLASVINIK
jgi:ubiquinone biosynthesis protein COQ9